MEKLKRSLSAAPAAVQRRLRTSRATAADVKGLLQQPYSAKGQWVRAKKWREFIASFINFTKTRGGRTGEAVDTVPTSNTEAVTVTTPEQNSRRSEQAPEEPVWKPEWLTWQPEVKTRSKSRKEQTKAVTRNTSAAQVPEVAAAAPALEVDAPPLWQPSGNSSIPQWALPFQRANQDSGPD